MFVFLVALLSTALAAVVHRRLFATYIAHQRELRASEDLRVAQMRAFLSENAAAMGRLAAALSHELNSPVGVIKSCVDTLEVLVEKKDNAGESERRRLEKMQHELLAAARASAERLHEIVGRMLRFTNLDRAEMQSLDLNSLVRDVAYLVESDLKGVARIELALRTLPPVTCRPQQVSAVFSNLLYIAVEASGPGGAVRIATHCRDGQVEVRIDDSGPGLDTNALRSVFEPGFRVRGNRVATGNWSLFSARQVIREQGGEISVESRPGQGTTVTVVLPGEEQAA